jgi:hypothetical protein
MWAVGRRTGFFVVSYAPLAAMFAVLKWPNGWSATELVELGVWLAAIPTLVLLAPSLRAFVGVRQKVVVGIAVVAALLAFILGLVRGWYGPMDLSPDKHKTAATASGVAFCVLVLALQIVLLIVSRARLLGDRHWKVTDPRDQGAAVAGYLATYLLPLIGVGIAGWRVTVAYGIYLATLYLVFVRSESLVLVNPTLYIFNYRIYDVEIEPHNQQDRRRVLLLTKSPITQTTAVDVVPLGDRSFLTVRPKETA